MLIAGGYLILDPEQIGLALALSARIHVVTASDDFDSADGGIITVSSPQFLNAQWVFKCTIDDSILHVENMYGSLVVFNIRTPNSSNDYVRITVSYVLSYLQLSSIPSLTVTILADNDYYSQTSSPTYTHLSSLPRFNNLGIPISQANKTGLGSSAALITSLTASLLTFLSDINVTSKNGKRLVHNLAQAAHCAAQGKVGSGFDIAAAVYGSCIYRRFDPKVLQDVLLDSELYDAAFRNKLRDVVGGIWEMEVTEFRLPSGLRVVMGDVAAGSATPGMVRSVLKWKSSSPGAEDTWKSLGASNVRLIELFNKLRQFASDEIKDAIRRGMSSRSQSNTPVDTVLSEVTETFEVKLFSSRLMQDNPKIPSSHRRRVVCAY